jgi:hypothetical protein
MNLGCLVVPKRLGIARANQAFDEAGRLKDPQLVTGLDAVVKQVVQVAGALHA